MHASRLCTLAGLLLLLDGSWMLPAQTASTTSTTSTTAPATSTPTSTPTLKASAQLVVVDVVVTDRSGQPVHGLRQQDFTLSESGTPQTVNHFEEHSGASAAGASAAAPMPKMPPGLFTNYTPQPENNVSNLILLDTLNTPAPDQPFVRAQLLAYLKTIKPGTRVAIFGLTSQLIELQPFTTNPEVLLSVITGQKVRQSPLLGDAAAGRGIQNSIGDDLEDLQVNSSLMANMIANVRQFEAEQKSLQLQLRARYTLTAMSELAHFLAGIPGRKNLIWFSGSFPISILPDQNIQDPFAVMADVEAEFRATTALLGRSQVAVYPIDARGLFNSPVFDAATTRNYGGGKPNSRFSQDLETFSTDTAAEHATMRQMAEATGGRAFLNTNGLAQAASQAIQEGSQFYTLTYTPTNGNRNGDFRKIKVQLAHSGYTLAYRHGYYAENPDKQTAARTDAVVAARKVTEAETLRAAMMRGAPLPTEILIKAAVFPVRTPGPTEDTVPARNVVAPSVHGPFRRYSVTYAIQASDLAFFRGSDGKARANLDLIIFVFDAKGTILNSVEQPLHLAASLEDIRKAAAHGLIFNEQVSAPAQGEYFLRIAVRDNSRDRFGAVEVATSAINHLPPVDAPEIPGGSTSSPSTPASTISPTTAVPGPGTPHH